MRLTTNPPRSQARCGAIAAQVAIFLAGLMAVTALSLEMGTLYAERRDVQAAADAAALAAAADLYKNFSTNQGSDPSYSAYNSALATAAANGYAHNGENVFVTVRRYTENYLGGPNAGNPVLRQYVEVTIRVLRERGMSRVFGGDAIPIQARAVARGGYVSPKSGIIVLDPYARSAMTVTGNGNIEIDGGIVVINSSHSNALVNNSNGVITANGVDVYGGTSGGGTYNLPDGVTVNTDSGYRAPDPLAVLPAPPAPASNSTPTTWRKNDVPSSLRTLLVNNTELPPELGGLTQAMWDAVGNGRNIHWLTPGKYNLGNYSQNDLLIFGQARVKPEYAAELPDYPTSEGGVYYLTGGLKSTGASIVMDPRTEGGLMLYNASSGNQNTIEITGREGRNVYLRPPDSGVYQGTLLFQDRSATQRITVEGNGWFTMLGTFYAANAEIRLTGSGSRQSTIASQVVSRYLTLSGNGDLLIAFSDGDVRPIRMYMLVE